MDPLSISASIIAVIQAANKALSVCFDIRAALNKAPWALVRVLEETKDLRNILEALFTAVDEQNSLTPVPDNIVLDKLPNTILDSLNSCLSSLLYLDGKLRKLETFAGPHSKRAAFIAALCWQFQEHDAHDCLQKIERCKSSLILAIASHQSALLLEVQKTTIQWQTRIEAAFQRMESTMDELSRKSNNQSLTRDVIKWMSPLSYYENHRNAVNLHQAGTSGWLLDTSHFMNWFRGDNHFLWLKGTPGVGKTLLFSHVTEFLVNIVADGDNKANVAYAYCDFRNPESHSPSNILGAILAQCCAPLDYFPERLMTTYRKSYEEGHSNGPPVDLLEECLLELLSTNKAFILVDALDESSDPACIATMLRKISETAPNGHAKFLVTGREIEALSETIGDVAQVNLGDYKKELQRDIQTYIGSQLQSEKKFQWLTSDIQNHISDSLNRGSNSMFRWVQCQLESIKPLRTVKAVRTALNTLPLGLEDTYARILLNVPPQDVGMLRSILDWLCFSVMPLNLSQVYEAMSIEPENGYLDDESRLRNSHDILSLGNSLLNLTAEGQIHLAHLSVRDFLLSKAHQKPALSEFILTPSESNRRLALTCLTYLCLQNFSCGPANSSTAYVQRIRDYPLLKYASFAWPYHVIAADTDDMGLTNLILKFFNASFRQNFMSWVQVLNANYDFKWNVYPKHVTPLYYAASFGLHHILSKLILQSCNIDAPGSRFGGTAVHAAAYRSHMSSLRVLLEAGADALKADFNNITPLHSAAANGNIEVINMLLTYGARIEEKDDAGETAYDWAIGAGQLEAARLIQIPDRLVQHEHMKKSDDGCSPPLGPVVADGTVPYFPNIYGGRSGLNSSIVVQVTIGNQQVDV